MARTTLSNFTNETQLQTLFQQARQEDLVDPSVVGRFPDGLDLTSGSLIPETLNATAHFRTRASGRLAGAATLPTLLKVYDPHDTVKLQTPTPDGTTITPGQTVATLTGPMRLILAIERVALNTMCHLSGIASLTARYAELCIGTKAKIYDTRKTLPGLRRLQKYAVTCGGGHTHRMGLYDALLVKDNHLAHLNINDYAQALQTAIDQAQRLNPNMSFAMVEVDTLPQLAATLPVPGVDLILLDNMPPDVLTQAVSLRDRIAPHVELEASGGINLQTVRAIAQTNVDRISVGALTCLLYTSPSPRDA